MKISDLVEELEEQKKAYGDLEVECFHHDGGNSLRGGPVTMERGCLYIDQESETLKIGFNEDY